VMTARMVLGDCSQGVVFPSFLPQKRTKCAMVRGSGGTWDPCQSSKQQALGLRALPGEYQVSVRLVQGAALTSTECHKVATSSYMHGIRKATATSGASMYIEIGNSSAHLGNVYHVWFNLSNFIGSTTPWLQFPSTTRGWHLWSFR
jgi:hypothetical protein